MRKLLALLAMTLIAGACTPDDGQAVGTPDVQETPVPGFSWASGAAMPTPRTEVAAAVLDGRVYVAGGFTADGSTSAVVEVYDPDADTWEAGPTLDVPVHHAGLAAWGGELFLVGGYGADGRATDEVWRLRSGDAGWVRAPSLSTPRGALAVAVVEGAIHAIGGATGMGRGSRLTGAHEVLDTDRERWQEYAELPDPRDHLAAAAHDGLVYVAGGRYLSMARNVARIDVFDTAEGAWRRAPDMPTARGGLAATVWSGRLVVVGGEEPDTTFAEVERFDPTTQIWESLPGLPTPRHGLGAVVTADDERLIVVSGGPEPGLHVSGTVEILSEAG